MMKYIYTQRALRTICHTDCTEFTPVPVNIYQNYILKVIEWKWNHYIHGKMIPFHKENHENLTGHFLSSAFICVRNTVFTPNVGHGRIQI